MVELWKTLFPLILASAVLPAQTIFTLLLVRSSVRSAFAWVAGMTAARLIQGIVFGFVLPASERQEGPDSPRYFVGVLLLLLAALLYVKAAREALGAEDEDAPPPKWVAKAGSMSPWTAFGAGAGFMTISVKYLVFTLGTMSAIIESRMGVPLAVLTFLLFVVLAECVPVTILALAVSPSSRSAAILKGFGDWLRRRRRAITIVFGLVFGTWFLIKALRELSLT
jgi:threonine/homoserine/homoserine lactone efflux protein